MKKPTQILILFFIIPALAQGGSSNTTVRIDVGVVLDLGTFVGKTGLTSISMAMDDFYSLHSNYTTRLVLHSRDSNSNTFDAVSAALDLLKNVQVQAILGPQKSAQAVFISDLGNKTQVPIISFSVTSPSLTSSPAPYFVRMALNDSSQTYAISSIVGAFGWREVVPIYEDTTFGTGLIPYLIDALYAVDARVPYRSILPLSITDDQLLVELYKLMIMQTRVFIVHMSASLGSRLFLKAREVGMMSKGCVWIMTDGLTSILDSMDPLVINSMQGVLGVRQYVPDTREFDDFAIRWERRFRKENPDVRKAELSIYGLWAYDATWALATAAEKVGVVNPNFWKPEIVGKSNDLKSLGVSEIGSKLLEAISKTEFAGLSGNIHLIDRQLQSSTFQIINVIGRLGREIGFWTPSHGISRNLNVNGRKTYSTSMSDLSAIIWPGELMAIPKGWEIPVSGTKLRIGVPVKSDFVDFVKVERDPITNVTTVGGYCIDIFEAVVQILPYAVSYEYIPFEDTAGGMSGSYDDLVYQVNLQKYDAVVGDVTIRANRSLHVDFTLPFTDSGVAMIVPVKEELNKNAWIFLKPLTMDLWLGSLAFFFYTGFVVWVFEHRINKEFRGTPSQQFGIIFYFSFSTLVFAHREKVENFLSKVVVIIWLFVVLILTSSYTASLTSMLTVQQLQPTVTDVNQLLKNGDYVGFDSGSFVEGLLKELNFSSTKLRPLRSSDEYVEALSKGSSNGGVSAVFHEYLYIKLFLSQHCTGYTMVGPTEKTAGFGFVFPRGSPLVNDMSRAILNVTEGEKMVGIEKKWFGDQTCPNIGSTVSSQDLNFRSFWGLFMLTGTTSTCALLIFCATFLYKNWHEIETTTTSEIEITTTSENSIWQRLVAWAQHYDKRDLKSPTFKRDDEHMNNAVGNASIGMRCSQEEAPSGDAPQSPSSLSNITHVNSSPPCEGSHSQELGSEITEASPCEGSHSQELESEITEGPPCKGTRGL